MHDRVPFDRGLDSRVWVEALEAEETAMATRTRTRGRMAMAALAAPILVLGSTTASGTASPNATSSRTADDFTAQPLTPTSRIDADKSPSSQLAESSPSLLRREDDKPVRVMIKLDYDAVASYQGGVRDLRATSPSVTGRPITGATAAERDYTSYVKDREGAFVSELRKAVPSAEVGQRLRVVYGGVAAVIPANAAKRVLAIDGVTAVQLNRLEQPLTDSSPEFVNAPPVYDQLGSTEDAGAGVIYGNLDTGIWPEHPSFEDQGNLKAPPDPARECNYGDNPLTPANDPFVCQDKLIGGAHFTDDYDQFVGDDPLAGTARDGSGHGTHTSSTSAGNIVDEAPVFGVDRGPIHGLAPGAWVMEYKVCGPQGCFGSDSAAAVAQAILDGVDVINFSISGGNQPFSDPVELAFLDAYAANVLVSASAGNAGPGAGTTNHLGPWTTTVAASTQTREFASTLSLSAENGDTFTADGASITAGVEEPLPVVLASDVPGYEDALCSTPADDGSLEGMIVACERGGQARALKGFHVAQGDAAGMVLYNPTLMDNETDNHWLPTVHLADGTDFVAYMENHSDVTGSFTAGEAHEGQGDVMAAFSSRGPGGLVLKPDVTAPGVQILAGNTPYPGDPTLGAGPPGEQFQAIAGTSMSSPHVAGAALLVRAAHPDWTPGQIKSALMTTSVTDVVKEDLVTPADPFDFGAGRIDIGASADAPATIDETAEGFLQLGGDPVNAVHLNIPSINAPVMPGRLVTTRTIENTSEQRHRQRFTVDTEAPAGSQVTVTPSRFMLQPGESQDLTVVIESDAPLGEQQFGRINIESRAGDLHLPVAFIHTQGDVTLTQGCSPETIQRNELSECTVEAVNNTFDEQVVDLDTFTDRGLSIESADGATMLDPQHAQRHDVTLTASQAGVPAVDPGALSGYLPLDAFGVTPIPIDDEQIFLFNSAPFTYAGQTWTQFGVDSNGYLVAGEATGEDNNCCNLPAGPDPSRPNNVLAPFWTDLEGLGGADPNLGLYVATLQDSETGDQWNVVEFRLNVFGTDNTQVFQIWMGLNGTEDITYAYDPANLPSDPNGQAFLVGAENQLGEGDMVSTLPTQDQRVMSSEAVPGGRVNYTFTVRGKAKGDHTVRTEMAASLVPGVTIVRDQVHVTTGGRSAGHHP